MKLSLIFTSIIIFIAINFTICDEEKCPKVNPKVKQVNFDKLQGKWYAIMTTKKFVENVTTFECGTCYMLLSNTNESLLNTVTTDLIDNRIRTVKGTFEKIVSAPAKIK